jgi:hypothetical protein
MLFVRPQKRLRDQMPPYTDSIASVRRERDKMTALRQQIRDALASKGTLHTKRAVRDQAEGERSS